MPYFNKKRFKFIEDTISSMRGKIYTKVADLNVEAWTSAEPLTFDNRLSGAHMKLEKGTVWGKLFDCAWFHFTAELSSENAVGCEKYPIFALIDVSGEGCIVNEKGEPVQGITCVEYDFERKIGLTGKRTFPLYDSVSGGEIIDFWMDAGCNDLFGTYHGNGSLKEASIVYLRPRIRELFYDLQVLFDLARALPDKEPRYQRLISKLYEGCCLLHKYSDEELDSVFEIIKPELEKRGGDPDVGVSAVGHAHIDLAWLWPIRETIRKGARTFSTVLWLMDEYPDYVFGASQPQLFQWMKEYYPSVFERIRDKIKEKRFEVQGAMWTEADTNLVSGESLVRQILYGMRFYEEEFGIKVKSLWLPDVFGYSAALPQILKSANIDYFMTQKLSWNDHNKFPHQSFWWEGIDGSKVLTHMLPEETYNSPMSPAELHRAVRNYKDSGVCEDMLMLFGIGDGGGGPGREHLERAKRMKNLSGLVPVKQEPSYKFFEKLEKYSDKLTTWSGELYLERHQGTYTSQAKVKFYNRKMEQALRELEFAAVLNGGFDSDEKKRVDEIWREVLLYQFHDIIPGSSIKRVYDECTERYEILLKEVSELYKSHYKNVAKESQDSIVFNSLPFSRSIWVQRDEKWKHLTIPALGYISEDAAVNTEISIHAEGNIIENEILCATFGDDGSVCSIYDKINEREVLKSAGGLLQVYREEIESDCWDINISYLDTPYETFELVSQETKICGVVAKITQGYKYGNSKATLTISLESGKPYLEFLLEVDWQENLKMLRTSFPTNIHTTQAAYEIQFGKIYRPTHSNTTWDLAKFEVCAHRFVDLSQPDYGVALLNDCKYGFRAHHNILDMNILRSQNHPGDMVDRGRHQVRYAIYPHNGDEQSAQVYKHAYEFNIPTVTIQGEGSDDTIIRKNWTDFEGDIVIDTVKPSEDGKGVVMRMYEPNGQNRNAEIRIPTGFNTAYICDIHENKRMPANIQNGYILWNTKPFELLTLRLDK